MRRATCVVSFNRFSLQQHLFAAMSETFLLRDVGQFMREQSPACLRARFVLPGGEGYLIGYREGARARRVCRGDSVVASMDAHTAEIATEARFKVSARRRVQR